MADLRIEALDYARKLSAALEQGITGDAAQIKRLEGHLIEARDELASAYNIIKNRAMLPPDATFKTDLLNEIAGLVDRDVRREIGSDHAATKQQLHALEHAAERAIAILNGDPCRPPLPGEPLTRLEEAALSAKGAARRAEEIGRVQLELSEARAELDRARVVAAADLETLRSRDADIAKLEARASLAESANRDLRKSRDLAIGLLDGSTGAAVYVNESDPLLREIANRVIGGRQQVADLERKAAKLEADLTHARKVIAFADEEGRKIRAALDLPPLAQASDVIAAMGYPDTLNGVIKELRGELADAQDEIAAAEADLDRVRGRLTDRNLVIANVLVKLSSGSLSTNGAAALIREAIK